MSALNNVEAVSQDKPIWITEAGWPVSGPAENQAVASIDNSRPTGTSSAVNCSTSTMSGGTFSAITMARLRRTLRSALLVLSLGSRCLILLALLARRALRSLVLLELLLLLPLLLRLLPPRPLLPSLPQLRMVTLRRLPTRLLMPLMMMMIANRR